MQSDKLWSLEAEAAVLGSIIVDSDCFNRVLPILPDEEIFYNEQNQAIYAALLELFAANQPIDGVALRTQLKSKNQLEMVGGWDYLQQIVDTVPSSANAVYYAGVVRDRQRYRGLMVDLDKMRLVLDEPISVDEQVQGVQDIALNLQRGNSEDGVIEVSKEAAMVAATMHTRKEVIETGFRNIDNLIQGVAPGEFCIVAGRPSMGKSALALCMALNMARKDKSVLFFTLEMMPEDLIKRAITNLAGITITDFENPKAAGAAQTLEGLDIVLHKGCATPESQIAFIRTRKKTHGVDVCFVDYLQLMSAGIKTENRQQAIATISRKLKLAAVQEQIPIIALSQMNRQVESRTSHRPRLSDLRDSGAIEQDADTVLLLHREDYYRRNEEPETTNTDGIAELIVAKNRNGPTGIAKLVFVGEFVKFGDLSYV